MRALIVEDEPQLMAFLSSLLTNAGLIADRTTTIDAALAALRSTPFDIAIVRRGLCQMTYADAGRFVRDLLQHMKIGGKLYLSVLGLHSVLGENYPHADLPITDRFSHLSPLLAEKYVIPHAVCLYTERNLFQLLLECGMAVTRTLTTTYGNVQAVAVRI